MGTVLHVRPRDADEGAWTGEGSWTALGVRVRTASTVTDALATVRRGDDGSDDIDCAVVDRRVGGEGDALATIEGIRERCPDLPVLCCSAHPDGVFAAAATRRGATEYVPRGTDGPSLVDRVATYLPDRDDGGDDRTDDDAGGPVGIAGERRETPDGREYEADVERYEAIVEAVDDAVYALDDEGRFEVVNDAMTDLTGYDREELLGEHTAIVKDAETVALAERKLRDLLRGDDVETTFELELQPKAGEPVTCEDHMTMLTDDGAFDGTAGVIRDITDRKEQERRLRAARERLADLLDSSEALLEAHDREAVAEVVADAAADALGFDYTLVRLHDPETDRLEAVAGASADGNALDGATGDGTPARDGESSTANKDPASEVTPAARPTYAADEGGPGAAFAAGEIRHYPSDFETGVVDEPERIVEALYVPLGERGVLSVGATEADAFDTQDRSLAEILGSNAAVALDRVAYEEELVQYRTVLENVQDMVYVVDEDERFSLVTDPLAEWLGYDREELVGAHPSVILDEGATEDFEAAIADIWYDAADRAEVGGETGTNAGAPTDTGTESGTESGTPPDSTAGSAGTRTDSTAGSAGTRTVEVEFHTTDGETRPATVDVSLLPVEEGFAGSVGVVRDRSELREARAKLQTQRDRFSYLFDNLPDAVVEGELDERGSDSPDVTDVNDAFVDVFGYEPETVVGETLDEFVLPPDDRDEGADIDRRIAAGEVVQREVRRLTAGGYRDFLFRGIPYDTSGEYTHGFGIYTDITEQKERERRLEVLNRVLRHNLRNDLNVVLGYAEMLSNRTNDDTIAEWADTLREKASEVATLGDRVRSLDQRMRRGSARDDDVDIAAAVDDAVETFRADHSDAAVETDVPAVSVVGDGRLSLALSELLHNSAEHADSDVRVRITATCEDRRVALRVADDGPGIPDHEQSIVTESDEITQLNHGSGLGLWIVKWVCDSCGGRLHFEESDLGGTAVVLSLTPTGAPH